LDVAKKELQKAEKDLDEIKAYLAKLKETFQKQMDEKM